MNKLNLIMCLIIYRTVFESLPRCCKLPETKWQDEKSLVLKIVTKVMLAYEKRPENLVLMDTVAVLIAGIGANEDSNLLFVDCRRRIKKIICRFSDNMDQQFEIVSSIFVSIKNVMDKELGDPVCACKVLLLPALSSVSIACGKKFYGQFILDIINLLV